jgi:hypothetical protein
MPLQCIELEVPDGTSGEDGNGTAEECGGVAWFAPYRLVRQAA